MHAYRVFATARCGCARGCYQRRRLRALGVKPRQRYPGGPIFRTATPQERARLTVLRAQLVGAWPDSAPEVLQEIHAILARMRLHR